VGALAGRNSAGMPCRVFLADDVVGIRDLWRLFLEEDGGFSIVGEAGDGAAVLEGIAATRPDVVVLDLCMPGKDGLEVLQTLSRTAPDVAVVIATGFAGSRLSEQTFELGARGFFEKGCPGEELVAAVRSAVRAGSAAL
jgi:DNA-binding NarL/FixJ family response regulator